LHIPQTKRLFKRDACFFKFTTRIKGLIQCDISYCQIESYMIFCNPFCKFFFAPVVDIIWGGCYT
jgi:hypothetical protein